MYTVCPECKSAFRLNAKILKQAHGRVRCGGCSSTFNAIDHLAEDLPDDEPGNTQTAHTFDERSKELLQTLDQLTGPDAVRIEDTGVEWRVLDVDKDSGNDGGADTDETDDSQAPGAIQWSLEDADNDVPDDNGGTAEYSAHAAAELEASDEPEINSAAPQPAYSDEIGIEEHEAGDAPEMDFGASDAEVEGATADDPATEPPQDIRYDDNTPLPDEFFRPSDDFPTDAPAADSEHLTTATPPDLDETPTMAGEELSAELAFGDIDEWQDLLSEVTTDDESEAPASDPLSDDHSNDDREVDTDASDDTALQNQDHSDSDSVEPATDEVSLKLADTDLHSDDVPQGTDDTLVVSEFVPEPDAPQLELEADLNGDETVAQRLPDDIDADTDADTDNDYAAERVADEPTDDGLSSAAAQDAAADAEASANTAPGEAANDAPAADLSVDRAADDDTAADDESAPEQPVDDRSVEMEIDQELMRAAAESADDPDDRQHDAGENLLVETIIMEGDTVTDLIGDTELQFNTELLDTGLDADQQAADGTAAGAPPASRRRRGLGIAATLVLGLLLAAQLLHANRATLATSPVFESTLAPIYRAIGQPVTPAWDVRGWRFESTTGSTDNTDQRLTINSRISNKSKQALPYPLVYVSLTDRFEEIVGSRILRPEEYLAGNVSHRKPVAPGADFNAVITIDSPAPEATGFKLNVCYRTGSQQLRCAIEDFRQ